MAETFSIALNHGADVMHVGEIDIKMVRAVAEMAKKADINLGKISRKNEVNTNENELLKEAEKPKFKKTG
jgi:thiamine monophosphate synthase